MPELPEVENIKLAITPLIINKKIREIIIRESKLRWYIPQTIKQELINQKITQVSRKNKYLIMKLTNGLLIFHFGMSGHIKILPQFTPPQKHDHVDIILTNNLTIRYHDPRKFGGIQYFKNNKPHNLFNNFGPEPLTKEFNVNYLYTQCQKSRTPIKSIIMNNKIVGGIGNIYANESLFRANISPTKEGNKLSKKECLKLLAAIKYILKQAIIHGGTTLKDFKNPQGKVGNYQKKLLVYGRSNQQCLKCKNSKIIQIKIGQRSSFFCPSCQK